jgi:hypothetical protein
VTAPLANRERLSLDLRRELLDRVPLLHAVLANQLTKQPLDRFEPPPEFIPIPIV